MRWPAFLRRPSRLALRVYVIGLIQFLIVTAAMEIDHSRHERPPPATSAAQFVVWSLARVLDDPVALQSEVDHIGATLGWTVDVRTQDGRLLAHGEPSPRAAKEELRRNSLPIPARDGREARMDYIVHPMNGEKGPPGPPWAGFNSLFVLAVVGVASWVIARSIVRPIHRLAAAARSFGEGHLDARADIVKMDEVGETARAFNDMADRIAKLLLAERELLANVSHELRTPLARIRVALDLASEGDARMAMESLGEIAQDLAELERIVEDVLASARLAVHAHSPRAAAEMLVRAEELDTRALLEKSVLRFRAAHHERPLDVRIDEKLPRLFADPVLVRRVVDNLLDNAHKYTEAPDEPIALEARADDGGVVIEVRDHGIGIAEADLDRLFEPFFRADRSRARATGGLGLGLALARRIVEAHKGTITFSSGVDKGTVARVWLPAEPS